MVEQLIGKRISIPGQFTGSVTVESVTVVDDSVLLQVRTQLGELREAILSSSDIAEILAHQQQTSATTVDANSFFLFIESARIKTAFAYDHPGMQNDPLVEAFAMQYVMDYERDRGWEPLDISKNQDGSGFDIRSVGPVSPKSPLDKGGLEGGIAPVRRIEVKGRSQNYQQVSLTVNEWRKAQQLGDSYWLYVVWGCKTDNPQLLMIPNPAKALAGDAKEIKQVTRYLVGAEALQKSPGD
jgi:Domain of unknown function (DUF3883)